MIQLVKDALPLGAAALIGALLLIGEAALAILALAGSIAVVPLVYAPDVEDIARATRDGELDH